MYIDYVQSCIMSQAAVETLGLFSFSSIVGWGVPKIYTYREREGETYRQTDRQTERERNIYTYSKLMKKMF